MKLTLCKLAAIFFTFIFSFIFTISVLGGAFSSWIYGLLPIGILAVLFWILYRIEKKKIDKQNNVEPPKADNHTSKKSDIQSVKPIQTPQAQIALWTDFRKGIIPYYSCGFLTYITPPLTNLYEQRDKFYRAKYIMSDGVPYNLHDADSIRSIALPNHLFPVLKPEYENLGVTGRLEYVLQRKAGYLRESGEHKLSIILMQKTHELMWHSSMNYTKKDYMQLVNWLIEDGRFDEAEACRKAIEQKFKVEQTYIGPHFLNDYSTLGFQTALQDANKYGLDYIRACNKGSCCAECAKYRDRIYCISGNDKRFPQIPVYNCDCSGIAFIAWYEELTEEDVMRSNRPFVDDRDDEEKRAYQYVLDHRAYQQCAEDDRVAYNKLKRLLSEEDMPKSFGAFRRMKNGNTKNFQALAEKAAQVGIDITMPSEERTVVERYLAYCKEHGYKP